MSVEIPENVTVEMTDSEKLDYMYNVVRKLDTEILPQLENLTAPNGPLGSVLGMFGLGR